MPDSAADVLGLLRRVPIFGNATHLCWSALAGGQSNTCVRVQANGEDFAVRLPASRPEGWPRRTLRDEWRVLTTASAAGVAPAPVWRDAPSGLLVTRFQPGPVWSASQMRDSANWPRLAAVLRKVHAIDLPLPSFDPVAAAERYWAHYCGQAQPSPRAVAAWRGFCAEAEELAAALEPGCLCHNDVMHSNVVGKSPILLDWEFAACSDPLFDLATVVVYHNLSAPQCAALLAEYLGGHDGPALRRLNLLCRLCRYVSWLWCLARLGREPVAADRAVALPA